MKNQILSANPAVKLTVVNKLHGLRHFTPPLASSNRSSHICRANTSRESPKSAISTGVAVSADNQIASHHKPLFRQQSMFNTHSANLIVEAQTLFMGKILKQFALICRLYVLLRRKVVWNQSYRILVKHPVRAGFQTTLLRKRT